MFISSDISLSMDQLYPTIVAVTFVYFITYIFTSILPGTKIQGYVLTPANKPTIYNLNGLQVLFGTITLVSAYVRYTSSASSTTVVNYFEPSLWLIFSNNYILSALSACCLGLVLSVLFYIRGKSLLKLNLIDRRFRCLTIDNLPKNSSSSTISSNENINNIVNNDTVTTPSVKSRGRSPNQRMSTGAKQQQRTGSTQPSTTATTTTMTSSKGSSSKLSTNSTVSDDTTEFDSRNIFMHFWCGLSEFNPITIGKVDIKMYLYIIGAVQLQINLLSMVTSHIYQRYQTSIQTNNDINTSGLLVSSYLVKFLGLDILSNTASCCTSTTTNTITPTIDFTISYAMAAYAFCLTFFIIEYLYHEEVHTYTYDIFRERIGFKLIWGCFCFYPFAYSIGGLPLITNPWNDITKLEAINCIVLYFIGWVFTRGANLQKFACKTGRSTFCYGYISMETVPGSNGRLLSSGFWGLSRHINYFGEILQAIALALIPWLATGSYIPWIYPLYYLALFIPRQIDDDLMCSIKYGHVWTSYVQKVPYRIIPYVY